MYRLFDGITSIKRPDERRTAAGAATGATGVSNEAAELVGGSTAGVGSGCWTGAGARLA